MGKPFFLKICFDLTSSITRKYPSTGRLSRWKDFSHLCGFVVLRFSVRGLQDIHDDGFHPPHEGEYLLNRLFGASAGISLDILPRLALITFDAVKLAKNAGGHFGDDFLIVILAAFQFPAA